MRLHVASPGLEMRAVVLNRTGWHRRCLIAWLVSTVGRTGRGRGCTLRWGIAVLVVRCTRISPRGLRRTRGRSLRRRMVTPGAGEDVSGSDAENSLGSQLTQVVARKGKGIRSCGRQPVRRLWAKNTRIMLYLGGGGPEGGPYLRARCQTLRHRIS